MYIELELRHFLWTVLTSVLFYSLFDGYSPLNYPPNGCREDKEESESTTSKVQAAITKMFDKEPA